MTAQLGWMLALTLALVVASSCAPRMLSPQTIVYNPPLVLLDLYRSELRGFCERGELTPDDCYDQRLQLLQVEQAMTLEAAAAAALQLEQHAAALAAEEPRSVLGDAARKLLQRTKPKP